MTDKQLNNRIAKLQSIEAQMKELEDAAETIRAEIKADLDSKALKAALPDVFAAYSKESSSRRFSIA